MLVPQRTIYLACYALNEAGALLIQNVEVKWSSQLLVLYQFTATVKYVSLEETHQWNRLTLMSTIPLKVTCSISIGEFEFVLSLTSKSVVASDLCTCSVYIMLEPVLLTVNAVHWDPSGMIRVHIYDSQSSLPAILTRIPAHLFFLCVYKNWDKCLVALTLLCFATVFKVTYDSDLLQKHYHPAVRQYSDHLLIGAPSQGAGQLPVDMARKWVKREFIFSPGCIHGLFRTTIVQ